MASANTGQRALLGVVEGFYGVFYTFPERIDMIRFIARHGYRQYIYGPKNDRQHRALAKTVDCSCLVRSGQKLERLVYMLEAK